MMWHTCMCNTSPIHAAAVAQTLHICSTCTWGGCRIMGPQLGFCPQNKHSISHFWECEHVWYINLHHDALLIVPSAHCMLATWDIACKTAIFPPWMDFGPQ